MGCQSCCLAQGMEHLPRLRLKATHQAPSSILRTSLCRRHQPDKQPHPPGKPTSVKLYSHTQVLSSNGVNSAQAMISRKLNVAKETTNLQEIIVNWNISHTKKG